MTRNKQLRTMVSCALFIAIQIILSRFLSIATPIVKIGFDFAPMALAGLLFGPWYACAVGALADMIGAILFPIGQYFPGFTVVAGMCGFTYGLLLHRKEGQEPYSRRAMLVRTVIAVLIVTLPMQLGLDTLCISLLYGKGFMALLPARAIKAFVMIPIQAATIHTMRHFVMVSKRSPIQQGG